jgi:hypothetical protein
MQPYPATIEAQMQRYYRSLSEKDRRRYAAIEALKLGHGGQVYIRRLFGCHHQTLQLGLKELDDETLLQQERIRQPGGGRKSAFDTIAGLDDTFLRVLEHHAAGASSDGQIRWINLNRRQISDLLKAEGIEVSVTVVDQLLEKHNFRKRQTPKTNATGKSGHRSKQVATIKRPKGDEQAASVTLNSSPGADEGL